MVKWISHQSSELTLQVRVLPRAQTWAGEDITEPKGLGFKELGTWRNWYTRTLQERMGGNPVEVQILSYPQDQKVRILPGLLRHERI